MIVRGLVQGVGYRHFCLQAAGRTGINGWVRNCADRSVEVEACGTALELDSFIEELREGPPMAVVSEIQTQEIRCDNSYQTFEVRTG